MKLLSHKSSLVEKKYAGKVEYETSPDSNQGYSNDIQISNDSFERCLFCRKSSGLDLLSHLDSLRVAEGIVQLVSVHVEKQLAGLVLNLAEGAWWSYNMTIWPVTMTRSALSLQNFLWTTAVFWIVLANCHRNDEMHVTVVWPKWSLQLWGKGSSDSLQYMNALFWCRKFCVPSCPSNGLI